MSEHDPVQPVPRGSLPPTQPGALPPSQPGSLPPTQPGSLPPTQPEYLGGTAAPAPRRSKTPLIAVASLGVVGVVAAGTWAAMSLMSSGEQAATAVPADAVAYVSLDLDPSAEQKLEAIRIMKKFPALDEELGLDAQDDLRRWAFEEMRADQCPDLDYDEDVAPWVGDRVAVAVLPPDAQGEDPVPMVALQVTDREAASSGIDQVAACAQSQGEDGPAGVAFTGDYAVLAETQAVADGVVADVESASLADDAEFSRWTGEVGDPGIVSVYVAAEAMSLLTDLQEELGDGLAGPMAGPMGMPGLFGGPGSLRQFEKSAEAFEGLAAVIRFQDGAVEGEMAAGGLESPGTSSDATVSGLRDLPAETGAALAFALPEGWLEEYLELMGEASGMPLDQMLIEGEAATGLDLPEDIEALLGDSVSVAVDSGLDVEKVMSSGDPSVVPAGVRVEGDPAEILPVVEKIKAALGPEADMVYVEEGDGAVAFGVNPEYVAALAGDGGLGDDASFRDVVPSAERAAGVLYIDFAGGDDWFRRLVEEFSRGMGGKADPEVKANLDALDALGASSWYDGDIQRGLFRLTTR